MWSVSFSINVQSNCFLNFHSFFKQCFNFHSCILNSQTFLSFSFLSNYRSSFRLLPLSHLLLFHISVMSGKESKKEKKVETVDIDEEAIKEDVEELVSWVYAMFVYQNPNSTIAVYRQYLDILFCWWAYYRAYWFNIWPITCLLVWRIPLLVFFIKLMVMYWIWFFSKQEELTFILILLLIAFNYLSPKYCL